MRLYLILFFLVSFSIAFVVREKGPQFSTAVLTQDCECQSSYFAYDRMEMMSKKLQLKKDRVLGKFCEQNENQVECRVERKDASKEGGVICPKACVSMIPTRPMNDERHTDLIQKKASEGRKAYASQVPRTVLGELQRRFPNWIPALVRQGEFQGYEPRYELAKSFVLDREQGKVFVLFYSDLKSVQQQQLSWILADSNTGEIIDMGDEIEAEILNHSVLKNDLKGPLGAR